MCWCTICRAGVNGRVCILVMANKFMNYHFIRDTDPLMKQLAHVDCSNLLHSLHARSSAQCVWRTSGSIDVQQVGQKLW